MEARRISTAGLIGDGQKVEKIGGTFSCGSVWVERMETICFRKPAPSEQAILSRVEVILLGEDEAQGARYDALMVSHHYLHNSQLVGERLRYVAVLDGQWLALVSRSAAAYHLKDRDAWIGWSETDRRRRLALMANNSRYAILPGVVCANLATRVLALNLARLSADWERAYGHPILLVESFVGRPVVSRHLLQSAGLDLAGPNAGFQPARGGLLH